MPYTSLSPAKAAAAARRTARQELDAATPWADVPEADGPDDVITRTIPLEGGHAIVEHVEGRVELTIRLHDRIVCGLALSPTEAEQIGGALGLRDLIDGAR